jgi:hypothetical protein
MPYLKWWCCGVVAREAAEYTGQSARTVGGLSRATVDPIVRPTVSTKADKLMDKLT